MVWAGRVADLLAGAVDPGVTVLDRGEDGGRIFTVSCRNTCVIAPPMLYRYIHCLLRAERERREVGGMAFVQRCT